MTLSTYGVVLLGNGSDLSLSVARSLHHAGITNIHELAVSDGELQVSKYSRHISTFYPIPSDFDSFTSDEVIRFGQYCGAQVLIPGTEEAVMWTSNRRDALSTYYHLPPLPPADLVQTLRSKLLLHQWLTDHQFPTPRIWELNQADIVQQLTNEHIAFPLLLKNLSGSVGHDVSRIRDERHLQEIIHFLGPQTSNYILQEYIEGSDMDCSFIALEGELLALTIQEPVVSRNLRFASSIRLFKMPAFRTFI
jgi:predicted ATP-grasp superfamily ATP-dependent carboligase